MDVSALHDEDGHAWALQQAALLRRLATSGLPVPNDLDLQNVAEEIEDLGNEQRFQVEGNLRQALVHLIKLACQPDDQAVLHWSLECRAFLDGALERFRPSMRRLLDMDALWRKACRRVDYEARLNRVDVPMLPDAMPFTLDELLDPDADPRLLADRLFDHPT